MRGCVSSSAEFFDSTGSRFCLRHKGSERVLVEEARRMVGTLLKENPGFSTEFARRKLFYLKRPEQLKLYLDGLALAAVTVHLPQLIRGCSHCP